MTWLGLLIGGIVGSTWGFKGTLLGALIGALIGMYLRRSAARANVNPAAPGRRDEAVRVPPAGDMPVAGTDPAMLPVRKGGSGAGLADSASDATPAVVSITPAAESVAIRSGR